MSAPDPGVLDALLRGTSRSFYLSLRLLPRSSAGPLGLSYLLARASDTIADTEVCPPERRLEHLARFAEALEAAARPGGLAEAERLCAAVAGDLTGLADNESERRLLERLPELVRAFAQLEPARRTSAGRCLATIIAGQRFDLEFFGTEGGGRVVALEHERQLERYCYQVAGCVGRLWTEMHAPVLAARDEARLEALAVRGERYGGGLQRINIARDLPRDLQRGRCYVPRTWLAACGLEPQALPDPVRRAAALPVYRRLLREAAAGLRAGAAYLEALPARAFRLRLATALPLLIGARTLGRLGAAREAALDPARRIKVSRPAVRRLLALGVCRAGSRSAMRGLVRRELRPLAALLSAAGDAPGPAPLTP